MGAASRQSLRAFLAIVLALAVPAALAASPGEWVKVGEARLTVVIWDVYDSTLYTLDGDYREGQRPLRLALRYLRDIDSASLVENTAREWDKQGMQHPERALWLERLGGLWPDIANGDELELVVGADGGSEFFWNGRALGGIADPDFGASFTGIWLAPNTSRPALRLALLGDG